jgi:hypothetical protein
MGLNQALFIIFFYFRNLRDFIIARPNRRKRRGTATIFVEFEKKEDGERFLEYCGSNQVNLFEAIGTHPAIDTIPPRHPKGYSRKYLS